jgi:hypothetical protein
VDLIQQQHHHHHHHRVSKTKLSGKFLIELFLAYTALSFMPTTTTNQSPDCQSILYPQTPPLAAHRPTRPTAVVPPLPKDPIISSPIGSITTASSMTPSSSNYQQISPQKPSNRESTYQKQVNN